MFLDLAAKVSILANYDSTIPNCIPAIHGKLLKDLEEKLQDFEKRLFAVADLIFEPPSKPDKSDRESLPRSLNRGKYF